MAKLTLAQVEYLSQQLNDQFKDVQYLTSKAHHELQVARDTLRTLLSTYSQWVDEEGLEHEQH